jgi:hypothetical protein
VNVGARGLLLFCLCNIVGKKVRAAVIATFIIIAACLLAVANTDTNQHAVIDYMSNYLTSERISLRGFSWGTYPADH